MLTRILCDTLLCFHGGVVNLGSWDSAIIKSLSWVALGIIVITLVMGSLPTTASDIAGLFLSSLLFLGIYLVVSLIGWICVGFPVHWVICQYANASFKVYVAVSILVSLILYFIQSQDSVLFALAALSQAMIFRFYVYKKT